MATFLWKGLLGKRFPFLPWSVIVHYEPWGFIHAITIAMQEKIIIQVMCPDNAISTEVRQSADFPYSLIKISSHTILTATQCHHVEKYIQLGVYLAGLPRSVPNDQCFQS